jgi:glycerol-3-phosphate dehydrogenase subunit B
VAASTSTATSDRPDREHDLLVVGGGLTGLAAARRARQLGLETVVVASTPGSLPYTSGALDLLGVFPTETKHYRPSPWEALSDLLEQEPGHPYGLLGLRAIRDAWEDYAAYLEAGPLGYYRRAEENVLLITAAGTLKPTGLVPGSMRANVLAWEARAATLIVGFERLMDFVPEHVVAGLGPRWPELRAARVDASPLLDDSRRVTPTALATALEREPARERLADAIRPLSSGARFIGLPAVLGLENALPICRELGERLGAEVFEIPLLSPSIPGIRLAELLKRDLIAAGVLYLQGRPISRIEGRPEGVTATREGRFEQERLLASACLLATGRFFGGGLLADRHGVRETVLGLAVDAPASRDAWHMASFLGAPGHPINRVGLRTDPLLRPLGADGAVASPRIFAAGAILGGHDWVREKSGAGISVATGYAAVDRLLTLPIRGARS